MYVGMYIDRRGESVLKHFSHKCVHYSCFVFHEPTNVDKQQWTTYSCEIHMYMYMYVYDKVILGDDDVYVHYL